MACHNCEGLRRSSTYERYKGILERHIKPTIGNMEIDQIKRSDVRNMLLKYYNREYSRSTVCLIRDVTSGVMGYAIDEELIQVNPVSGITKKLNLNRDKKATAKPMTAEEVSHFLETCQQYQSAYFPFFLRAFRTGMRLGELLALKWDDIDWFGKFIEVEKTFKNGITSPTKNGKSRRVYA